MSVPEVTLKDLIEKHLSPNHPVRKMFAEIAEEIPKELIYGTIEYSDGYCHDDVWIMMDLIHDKIGVRVENLKKCFGIGKRDSDKECQTCSAREACYEECEAKTERGYMG